ncbi:TlpA family protein disulfide reductase [Urbifossiella limnaea]|uniref:Thiol-disulfide oxidoreductase ResA n=1 Tax=Urbifossiella limnaea TaxID=2528023 RepID=A0A517Y2E4_9BACT|nr:thioredoxin-like domain-containing protein [Urbifossiella limnaea]QDU23937.1 Thiol-disulfide oxidoreductase ResA [Urbifossiella limnaea]
MRRGGGVLIAAVLALSGCKWAGTRPADKDKELPAAAASRPKGGEVPWLDEALGKLPGGDTGVPKAGSWAHPKDGNFNPTAENRGVLAGRVLDPYNQPAKNVFVRIEAADARPGEKAAAGVYADGNGYFLANGLRAGQAYTLTVNASADGRPLFATVQTRPPQAALVLALRDDLAPGAAPSTAAPVPPGTTVLPPPAPSTGLPPPSDQLPPVAVPPRPADGSWSPSGSARPGAAGVPPTLGGPPAAPAAVPPALPAPDRTAEGPTVPGRPPAANLPGPPPFPPLPVPPAVTPPVVAPPAGPTGQLMSRPRNAASFTLLDPLDRPWDFATHKHGSLVLLDFMTTTCVPCKRAMPTLNELQAKYAGNGLELIGVVCDDASPRERTERAARYGREQRLNYVLYTEPGQDAGAVRDRFGVEVYPTVVLLGSDGSVLYKGNPNDRSGQLESVIQRNLRR